MKKQKATKQLRPDKFRKFDGEVYGRVGQQPARTVKEKHELEAWARFQRLENHRSVRIVRVPGSWEAYISEKRLLSTRRGSR